MAHRSQLELQFIDLWTNIYPDIDLHEEYLFAKELKRQFRLDFAHPETKIGIEINGGIYQRNSGHSSIKGLERDYEKACTAAILGWRIFPLSKSMITEDWIQSIAMTIKESKGKMALHHRKNV